MSSKFANCLRCFFTDTNLFVASCLRGSKHKVQKTLLLFRNAPDEIYDLPAYVEIKRSKRARRLALRLDAAARKVNLVVPQGVSLPRARRFAEEHAGWIAAKIAALPSPIPLAHGQLVPVLGQERRISISYDRALRKTDIILKNNDILVFTNKEDPASRIVRFLKNLALEELSALSHEKAHRIGEKVTGVAVRENKSRWGSCSIDGRLCYSWRLVFAPYDTLDYLAAHEVAHLRHHDHSKAFWSLCKTLSRDYHSGKSWIRKNSQELLRYG